MANVKVFKTDKDGPAVQIAGVGLLGADGAGGVTVERAAKVMPELQERDDNGELITDDNGQPKPLEGAALNKAAQQLAEDRGWKIASVSEEKAANLSEELGVAADRPPLDQVSREAYEDSGLADLEHENTPEEMADTGGDLPPVTAADDGEATA